MHSCFLCIIVFLFSSKRLKADISLFKRRLLATFLKFLKNFSFHLFIVFARSVALFCICLAPAWKFTKLLCISGFSCLIYIKTPQETWLLGGTLLKRRVCEQRVLSVYTVTPMTILKNGMYHSNRYFFWFVFSYWRSSICLKYPRRSLPRSAFTLERAAQDFLSVL